MSKKKIVPPIGNPSQIEPPFRRIAALDIESLSTRLDAMITEIGYIICLIPKGADVADWRRYEVQRNTIYLDIIPQMILGRVSDPSALQFHQREFGAAYFREQLFGNTTETALQDPYSALRTLKKDFKDFNRNDELWMNHPTFDAGRLLSLATQTGLPDGLWYYGIEQDTATIKKQFDFQPVPDGKPHVAINDCIYNLDMIAELAKVFPAQWVPERSRYVRKLKV